MSATAVEQSSQAQRLEAEAEAGPGANTQPVNQNESTTNTELEKELNGERTSTPSNSSDHVVEEKKGGPPADDKPERSKGKVALLMGALAVSKPFLLMLVEGILINSRRWPSSSPPST
jgi:hypothetical protein